MSNLKPIFVLSAMLLLCAVGFAQNRPATATTVLASNNADSLALHLDTLQAHNSRLIALTPYVFEKYLTASETNIPVGFTLLSTSLIFLNGAAIKNSQWSGVGSDTVTLSLDTKLYDNLLIKK